MPNYARISGQYPCPFCSFKASDLFVQWGRVPDAYELGDTVRWHMLGTEMAPCWTLYYEQDIWNAGDPSLPHVFVRDTKRYNPKYDPRCPKCRTALGGAVVEVEGNRFVHGRLLKPDQLPEGLYLQVSADGTPSRIKEWEEKPLTVVMDPAKGAPVDPEPLLNDPTTPGQG